MAHLTLVLQSREVRKFILNGPVTTIGRAQDNDIVINNLALSRRHAQVKHQKGSFSVMDLGSQNGVFVNSERIRKPRRLTNEDTITLGTYQFIFSDKNDGEPDIRSAKPKKRRPEVTELEEVAELPELEPAIEADDPLLVLKYNDVELQRFALSERCLIGRAKDCDIQIAERRLSRRHCEVFREGDGFKLRDLNSQNGTYVNRKKIQRPHDLRHDDVLNFAEYSIYFLAHVSDYDGPDRVHAKAIAPRPNSKIEAEETEFPEAYDSQLPEPEIVNTPLRPSSLDSDPDLQDQAPPVRINPRSSKDPKREPIVEPPKNSIERRKDRPAKKKSSKRRKVVKKGAAAKAKSRPQNRPPAPDFDGDVADVDSPKRPDADLSDWYSVRDEPAEEPSLLLERSKSSMSQILSTMMVDKGELDRNLSIRARQRRFTVEVHHGKKRVFSGPLSQQVTILGTDSEADLQLKGRYVAGRHSILVRVKDSLLLVRLGSSSAARVNGLPKLQAFLKSGDVIQIDETTIKISEE